MGRASGAGLGSRLLVVELRSGGRVSVRVGHRFLQEGQVGSDPDVTPPTVKLVLLLILRSPCSVGRTTADPSMLVSDRLPRVGSATLEGQLSEGARTWQPGQYLPYHPPPEKTFSRFPIRVLKMRYSVGPSVCGEVRLVPKELNSGTNPGDLAEKVNSGTNPGDLAEKVNSGTNPGDLTERVNSGTNPGDLAERVNSGTNLEDLAEKVNSGTNPKNLAERVNSGINPGDLTERMNSSTNLGDLAERVNS
ncbi:hypothetical protein GW17_00030933, partial [Ensete ventricosum]